MTNPSQSLIHWSRRAVNSVLEEGGREGGGGGRGRDEEVEGKWFFVCVCVCV